MGFVTIEQLPIGTGKIVWQGKLFAIKFISEHCQLVLKAEKLSTKLSSAPKLKCVNL
jgi:hypothetical protein